MILILLQIIFFSFFPLYIAIRYGIQKSISDSWYVAKKHYEKVMFTVLFCYPVGLLMAFHGTPLFILSGAFLGFVGVATDFKSGFKPTPLVHYIGATGSILFAVIELARQGVYWTVLPILIGIWVLRYHDNRTWWVEINAGLWIIIGLIIINHKL